MALKGFWKFLRDALINFWRATVDLQAPFWFLKKFIQVNIRKHTSVVLALILAVGVCVEKNRELLEMGRFQHWPTRLEWFVLSLIVLTVLAAVWEFKGNKLTTSPQEERFLDGMRYLLFELEKFSHGQDLTADEVDVRLARFIQGFLEITTRALCGKKRIDAGLMVRMSDKKTLVLQFISKSANYQKGLVIKIPSNVDRGDVSPAGETLAHDEPHLTYMPKKKKERTWVFQSDDLEGRYKALRSIVGWVNTIKPEFQDFRSVLCVPVAVYQKEDEKLSFGVLNYSTKVRDPFVDRDFMMAECFASILAQAFAVAQQKKPKT